MEIDLDRLEAIARDAKMACTEIALTAKRWREYDAKGYQDEGREPGADSHIIAPPSWPTHRMLAAWEVGLCGAADLVAEMLTTIRTLTKERDEARAVASMGDAEHELEALRERVDVLTKQRNDARIESIMRRDTAERLRCVLAEVTTRAEAAEAEAKALREALVSIEEYWNGSYTDGAMSDALDVIVDRARTALEARHE